MNQELDIVNALQKTGLTLPQATLTVVMAVREHARPVPELVDIVRQYQNLETPQLAAQAIRELEKMNWLVESDSYGVRLLHIAPDLRDKIAARLNDPELSRRLSEMRSYLLPNMTIAGAMNDVSVYQTYLDIIRGAQEEICLPMLATSPNLTSVPLLQERASKGVKVRILLGSPKLTGKLRGATMVGASNDAVHGWIRNAENHPKMHVRVSDSAEAMQIASCMLVDSRLLRFDVYDPWNQRSLEGIMVEIKSPPTLDLNIIRIFRSHFELGWRDAKFPSAFGTMYSYLRRWWQWYFFGIFTLLGFLAFKTARSNWAEISFSAAGSFLFSAIVSSFEWIRSIVGRFRDLG